MQFDGTELDETQFCTAARRSAPSNSARHVLLALRLRRFLIFLPNLTEVLVICSPTQLGKIGVLLTYLPLHALDTGCSAKFGKVRAKLCFDWMHYPCRASLWTSRSVLITGEVICTSLSQKSSFYSSQTFQIN